ncbi:PEPxxWA-CTERM sorting domain-containing protein [Sphingomonas sp.]|uniref:PEPxxWA-CTERM sorting domain-containing protein n=1 Tax=Sphingomonas sp. TaxID=28214 RepID=UPI003CC67F4A
MKWIAAAAALLAAAFAAPAGAQTLHYALNGTAPDGTVEYASFDLDAHPIPLANNIGPDGFRIKFISGIFQIGSQVLNLQDLEFFTSDSGGGFISLDPTDKTGESLFLNVGSDQLFAGPPATPTLLTGNFLLFDFGTGADLKLSVAAVPEPAAWAMMILGFGAAGITLRRRARVRTAVAIA